MKRRDLVAAAIGALTALGGVGAVLSVPEPTPQPEQGTAVLPDDAPACAGLDLLARGADTIDAYLLNNGGWQVNGRAGPPTSDDSKLVRALVAAPDGGARGEGKATRLTAKRAGDRGCWEFYLELSP